MKYQRRNWGNRSGKVNCWNIKQNAIFLSCSVFCGYPVRPMAFSFQFFCWVLCDDSLSTFVSLPHMLFITLPLCESKCVCTQYLALNVLSSARYGHREYIFSDNDHQVWVYAIIIIKLCLLLHTCMNNKYYYYSKLAFVIPVQEYMTLIGLVTLV